ncbi:unnamed protein product [Polarella glacialis]|uniref:protein-tyrosine-phosphatase n=1 Tax=Polarella glacialis TaxID=89957 RepID=A0A813JLB7_POLGL|nr:unnamed protein product [Polarella glacialis]
MTTTKGSAATGHCPRITKISDQLLLGGLGVLVPEAIGLLLQEHAVTHLVVCGRPGADAHVAAAKVAMEACAVEFHLALLIPETVAELSPVLSEAARFVSVALEDDLHCVLVACSQGASRSVAVLLAHLLQSGEKLEMAFDTVVAARWRVWPSALLLGALLDMEDRSHVAKDTVALRQPSLSNNSVTTTATTTTATTNNNNKNNKNNNNNNNNNTALCRRVGAHAAWATCYQCSYCFSCSCCCCCCCCC